MRLIKYGNPVELAIPINAIDDTYIDQDDKKVLVFWLRGGQNQKITHASEEECRIDFDRIIKALEEE